VFLDLDIFSHAVLCPTANRAYPAFGERPSWAAIDTLETENIARLYTNMLQLNRCTRELARAGPLPSRKARDVLCVGLGIYRYYFL
jgi:hypothetical protein